MSPTAVPTSTASTPVSSNHCSARPSCPGRSAPAIRSTLLSCVKSSAWLVVDDDDVMVHLDQIAVRCGRSSWPGRHGLYGQAP